jgi:hypothetical protein
MQLTPLGVPQYCSAMISCQNHFWEFFANVKMPIMPSPILKILKNMLGEDLTILLDIVIDWLSRNESYCESAEIEWITILRNLFNKRIFR